MQNEPASTLNTALPLGNVAIRRAVATDCTRILELVHELALYEKAPQEVTVTLDHFTDSGFGPNPVWWAFVAELDGRVEGVALWYVRFSTWKGRRMYLEDFLVTEKLRGQGIGKQLFDRLLQEAGDKGFNAVVWQVLHWNEPAINFYKKYNTSFDEGWVNCAVPIG